VQRIASYLDQWKIGIGFSLEQKSVYGHVVCLIGLWWIRLQSIASTNEKNDSFAYIKQDIRRFTLCRSQSLEMTTLVHFCDVCGKTFSLPKGLQRHKESILIFVVHNWFQNAEMWKKNIAYWIQEHRNVKCIALFIWKYRNVKWIVYVIQGHKTCIGRSVATLGSSRLAPIHKFDIKTKL